MDLRLRRRRRTLGLTLDEVSGRALLSPGYISRLERELSPLTPRAAARLDAALQPDATPAPPRPAERIDRGGFLRALRRAAGYGASARAPRLHVFPAFA
jgi:transcriptional regulator with XRE-family HTH domain